ncbi:tail fiber domain-containing protein [Pontibacter russatus]|uniref:tail fiber domain-containing protein n=1 Tax=Pontibacter russatus TaxID=2694929 RepID=UPI00137B11D8|nr:tail fiber domain-containing protein [Pontibacter russatus]
MTYISKLVPGTKFPAPIGLTDDQVAKGVAFADANLLQGGHHVYDTIAERNAIPLQRRRNGMVVSVWEGATGKRPINYVLKSGILPGTPAGFSNTRFATPVRMVEEVDETSYEPTHPNYTGTDGLTQTITTPTGNMYAYLVDVLPDHPSAADPYLMVRLYGTGNANWYWFYADEPIEAKDETTWMVYEEFYDANGAYTGYTGTFSNEWATGFFYRGVSHLTAAPGEVATGEQPNMMGAIADQSDVWVKLEVEAPVIPAASYEALLTLRDRQQLLPNVYYSWPYRCVYQRQNGGEIITSATDEVLLTQAVDAGTLSIRSQSLNYPQDSILMDYQFYLGGVRVPWMAERRDEVLRLEARYDWRGIMMVREKVTGFAYETASVVAGGYEVVFTIGAIGSSLPTNYREYFVHFPDLNNPANPTITMRRGLGGNTSELKLWDGSSISAGQMATLLAPSGGKAYVMFSVELNCYTLMQTDPEERFVKDRYLGIPAIAAQQYDGVKLAKATADTRLYYTFNNEGYTNRDCKIEAFASPGQQPDIVLYGNVSGVYIASGSRLITIHSTSGAENIHLGDGCTDIHITARTKGIKLAAKSTKILVAGDDRSYIEVMPRSFAAFACVNNAYFLSFLDTDSTREMLIRHDQLENVTMRNRSMGGRISFGIAKNVTMNIAAGWDKIVFDHLELKAFEFSSNWNAVNYFGSRSFAVSASYRNRLENTVVIEGDNFYFPGAVASAEKTPVVMGADGRMYKWNATIEESATAGSIAKRDAAGGLTATEFTMTSDARLKTDLEHIAPEEALELVRQLSGYYYRRNDIENAPIEIGFMAQEVENIAPALTKHIPHHVLTDAMGVNYARAVALLAPAIQALLQRIEQLEKGQ